MALEPPPVSPDAAVLAPELPDEPLSVLLSLPPHPATPRARAATPAHRARRPLNQPACNFFLLVGPTVLSGRDRLWTAGLPTLDGEPQGPRRRCGCTRTVVDFHSRTGCRMTAGCGLTAIAV